MNRVRLLCFAVLACCLLPAQQVKAPSGFEISGTVVDSTTGQPLAGAHVGIAPVTQRNNFRIVITGEDGRFFFNGLSTGKYVLTGERKGYITQSFDQHAQYSTSIAVGPDLDAHNLSFRMRPQSSISGRILDEQNEPVRNAQVMLFEEIAPGETSAQTLRSRASTDDEGAYHFGHLSPGKYYVAVEGKPWYAQNHLLNQNLGRMGLRRTSGDAARPEGDSPEQETRSPLDVAYPITYYPGATEPSGAGSIALAAGEKFTADIILQPVPAIHTRIAVDTPDTKQHFSVDVRQRVLGDTLNSVDSAYSEASPGVLEISGIAPGHYSVVLNTWDEKGSRSSPGKAEVDLGAATESLSFQTPAQVAVNGVMKFDSGENPPVRGTVYLRNRKSGETLFQAISDKGEFEFKDGVSPGPYDVALSNVPQALVRQVTATGAKVAGQTVEIKGSAPVKLTILLTRGFGQVQGVALRDGKPTAGIMIVLTPDDPAHSSTLFRRDQSDSDGTFTLASIIPGKYTVLAIANGWELDYKNPAVLKPYLPQGTPVQVEAKGKYEIKARVQ